METLTLRPLSVADAPALTALLAANELVDHTGENYSEADIADELADASIDLSRDSLAAVAPDGSFAGWAAVRSAATVRDVDRVFVEGGVLPSRRGEGLGRRLLEWAEGRGAALHAERHPSVPGELAIGIGSGIPSLQRLAAARGFQPVRWWYGMKRDLSDLPAAPPVPAGLRLVPYDPAHDAALRLAHGEAFADHWGSVPPDEQRWAHWFTGSHAFRPDISLLVLAESTIAAYLLSYFWEADAAATGKREAYIGQIGTLAPWRRRGLGELMLATAMAGFAAAGYDQASLTVDTGNPTGALGLYERVGFTVDHESVTWAKPLG
ncbi:MAG TPA: GNAT family N-acetyltransferase [Mycobacteriales bacterium]|nr:GNAT family N-acetyltransferase [Mycobacteriales bacterium]